MFKAINRIKKSVLGKWRYQGITDQFMNRHSWTDGTETVHIYWQNGAGHHAGHVVEVESKNSDVTLVLSKGFVASFRGAMVLADLHMRMHSDRVESDKAPGYAIRQDEWHADHAPDYEFAVVDPSEVSQYRP